MCCVRGPLWLCTRVCGWACGQACLPARTAGGGSPRPYHPHHPYPAACRQLYKLLTKYEKLIGLWKGVGDGPKGSLFRFEWGDGHVQVRCARCAPPPFRSEQAGG